MQAKLPPSSEKSFALLKTLKLSDIYLNQQSLHLPLLVLVANVLEVKRVVRKQLLNGTKKLKKLFVQKKLNLELS